MTLSYTMKGAQPSINQELRKEPNQWRSIRISFMQVMFWKKNYIQYRKKHWWWHIKYLKSIWRDCQWFNISKFNQPDKSIWMMIWVLLCYFLWILIRLAKTVDKNGKWYLMLWVIQVCFTEENLSKYLIVSWF
jgi:hypothetical protein